MDKDVLAVLFVCGTPALALAGGIVFAIVKMIGQQRLNELMQRERIAAIEKGLDLSQLPFLATPVSLSGRDPGRRSVQGLIIGGLLTLALGIGLGLMLLLLPQGKEASPISLVPVSLGIALLISARIVRRGLDAE